MRQLRHSEAQGTASRRAVLLPNRIVMEKREMMIASCRNANRIRWAILALAGVSAMAVASAHFWGGEPYARHRDYDLQHLKIALAFDFGQRKGVSGGTHTLAHYRP